MLNFVVSQKALRPERSVGRLREIRKTAWHASNTESSIYNHDPQRDPIH